MITKLYLFSKQQGQLVSPVIDGQEQLEKDDKIPLDKLITLGIHIVHDGQNYTDTPIPSDHIAFTTSNLMRAIQQWPKPNESEASLMADLLDTIQIKNHNRAFLKSSFRKLMSTSLYVVFASKPVVWLH